MNSILEVKNLSFAYEKNKKVLDGVNLCIEEGSVAAILGKNGCGKSTLLDCIIGYNDYDEGQVIIDKEDIKGLSPKELSKKVAYISQNTTINLDYTVLEFILFGRTCHLAFGSAPKEKDYKIAKENEFIPVSESFKDEEGNTVLWEVRQLTNEEMKFIKKQCVKQVKDKRGGVSVETDSDKMVGLMAATSTVYPDLKNADLQNSYGVYGEVALLEAMLSAGELLAYEQEVNRINGFDVSFDDKVEEAKN